MNSEIDKYYQVLTSKIEELKITKENHTVFLKNYTSQSFLKKQFSFKLNNEKTELESKIVQLEDEIKKKKESFKSALFQQFYYSNPDSKIASICKENQKIISESSLETIKKNTLNPLAIKRYNHLEGKVYVDGIIRINGIKDDVSYTSSNSSELFSDYSGQVLPNGDAYFTGLNLEGSYQNLLGSHAPEKFQLFKKDDNGFLIKATSFNGLVYPTVVSGFNVILQEDGKSIFLNNCNILMQELDKHKQRYSEIFTK